MGDAGLASGASGVQDALQRLVDPVQTWLLQPLTSRERHRSQDITPDPRPDGRPPRNHAYVDLVQQGFLGWRFEINGLVESPLPHGECYSVIDLELARAPQTLLAYDMNGARYPLPTVHL